MHRLPHAQSLVDGILHAPAPIDLKCDQFVREIDNLRIPFIGGRFIHGGIGSVFQKRFGIRALKLRELINQRLGLLSRNHTLLCSFSVMRSVSLKRDREADPDPSRRRIKPERLIKREGVHVQSTASNDTVSACDNISDDGPNIGFHIFIRNSP